MKYCIDCNKKIDERSTRCHSCQGKLLSILRKNKKNPMYGRKHTIKSKQKMSSMQLNRYENIPKKRYFCEDCGKKVSTKQTKRCQSCCFKDKLNPCYIDGRSQEKNYSVIKNWSNIRLKILKRDNYTCQYCGMIEEEHLKKYNRSIEVHHIDYNRYNCEETNLITLCKLHNINANKDRDYHYAYYNLIIGEIYE